MAVPNLPYAAGKKKNFKGAVCDFYFFIFIFLELCD